MHTNEEFYIYSMKTTLHQDSTYCYTMVITYLCCIDVIFAIKYGSNN